MRKYIAPEIEIARFDAEDIITTSAVSLFIPKTEVEVAGNTYEASDFGTQPFSIFEEE